VKSVEGLSVPRRRVENQLVTSPTTARCLRARRDRPPARCVMEFVTGDVRPFTRPGVGGKPS